MRCLYCGKRLSIFRKFSSSEFCNQAHQQSYTEEQESLGLARLIEAKQRTPEPLPAKRSGRAAAQATEECMVAAASPMATFLRQPPQVVPVPFRCVGTSAPTSLRTSLTYPPTGSEPNPPGLADHREAFACFGPVGLVSMEPPARVSPAAKCDTALHFRYLIEWPPLQNRRWTHLQWKPLPIQWHEGTHPGRRNAEDWKASAVVTVPGSGIRLFTRVFEAQAIGLKLECAEQMFATGPKAAPQADVPEIRMASFPFTPDPAAIEQGILYEPCAEASMHLRPVGSAAQIRSNAQALMLYSTTLPEYRAELRVISLAFADLAPLTVPLAGAQKAHLQPGSLPQLMEAAVSFQFAPSLALNQPRISSAVTLPRPAWPLLDLPHQQLAVPSPVIEASPVLMHEYRAKPAGFRLKEGVDCRPLTYDARLCLEGRRPSTTTRGPLRTEGRILQLPGCGAKPRTISLPSGSPLLVAAPPTILDQPRPSLASPGLFGEPSPLAVPAGSDLTAETSLEFPAAPRAGLVPVTRNELVSPDVAPTFKAVLTPHRVSPKPLSP